MVQCYSRRDPCLVAREEHAPLTWSWPNMKCQILQALKGLEETVLPRIWIDDYDGWVVCHSSDSTALDALRSGEVTTNACWK